MVPTRTHSICSSGRKTPETICLKPFLVAFITHNILLILHSPRTRILHRLFSLRFRIPDTTSCRHRQKLSPHEYSQNHLRPAKPPPGQFRLAHQSAYTGSASATHCKLRACPTLPC